MVPKKLGSGLRDGLIPAIAVLGLVVAGRLFAFPVELATAPGNDLKLTVNAIQSAQNSLYINIYELKSSTIAGAIIDQINAGVQVEVLQEGQPVGGVSKTETELQKKIVDAMTSSRSSGGDDRYFVMTSKVERSKRRYRWDHAKYIVVDDKDLLVGSENYSENGSPSRSKPGNRGWESFLHDATLAKTFEKTFQDDTDLSYGDVEDLTSDSRSGAERKMALPRLADSLLGLTLLSKPVRTRRPTQQTSDLPENTTVNVTRATSIFSPDSESGLVDLIQGARKSLELELMTFSPKWGRTGDDSPLLLAVEAAARRGVDVRVLVNDETVFQHGGADRSASPARSKPQVEASKNNNETTVKELNKLADDENLSLEARIADLEQMHVSYIHNKGVLVDGNKVLVSSINWDQNSVENNREAGVVLESAEACDFYQPIFEMDWKDSE